MKVFYNFNLKTLVFRRKNTFGTNFTRFGKLLVDSNRNSSFKDFMTEGINYIKAETF